MKSKTGEGTTFSHKASLETRTRSTYREIREVAGNLVKRGIPASLSPTGLVHEAFIKLSQSNLSDWNDDRHFICAYAQAMRHVLVDRVRRKLAAVNGGKMRRLPLTDGVLGRLDGARLISLNDALEALQLVDSRQAEIVQLRFFAGFSNQEIADLIDVSRSTVQVEWRMAKAWLCRELND